ncbi:MAG: hypothetical protein GY835_24085 [bacterium]|nr:hypothetical protein [bacterium]
MTDEGINEVRRIRHQISEECGHDVDRLVSFYQKMEEDLRASGEFRFADDRPKEPAVSTAKTSPKEAA